MITPGTVRSLQDKESGFAQPPGWGTIVIQCARLDTLLANEPPTFRKLDIEGAELDALTGAAANICGARPVIAACIYHRADHLWKILLFLHSLSSDYCFSLRARMPGRLESVCYEVPNLI